MGILLLLIGYHVYALYSGTGVTQLPATAGMPPPLAGESSISNVRVAKSESGHYSVTFDYFFPGEPWGASLGARPVQSDEDLRPYNFGHVSPERGKHSITLDIRNPMIENGRLSITKSIVVGIVHSGKFLTKASVPYVIDWPSPYEVVTRHKFDNTSVRKLYDEAVQLIDSGNEASINSAQLMLEKLVSKDPTFAPTYLELARVAMKTNWGTEGLAQAEKHIASALLLEPDSANARVLLGYVYVHQQRYGDAEKMFNEAATIGTDNLWLWSNWGQMFAMLKKPERAIEMYMKAVEGERPYNTYDRARLFAYDNLFELYKATAELDKLDTLHRKRATEFANSPCYYADYARFRLEAYSDYDAAIAHAQSAVDQGCMDTEARTTLGVAYYYSWANTPEDKAVAALVKARTFSPESPVLYYQLASLSDADPVLKRLIVEGGNIDIQDNYGQTALSIALHEKDTAAASRLIKAGANVHTVLGDQQYPTAFIPIRNADPASIALMKSSGVDYSLLAFNGMSAYEFARTYGSPEIAELLEGKKL